jgi:hypothetical protein
MTEVRELPANGNEKLAYAASSVATSRPVTAPSKAAWWTGWVISGLVILWIGVAGLIFALTQRAMVEENMAKYGYVGQTVLAIQVVATICVILYAIPRTAVLGAILLTGYLGGAVSTHVRFGDAWFFPIIFGVLVWLGLYLRDPRLRALVPFRKV